MGCTASCPANFITQQKNPNSNSSSSSNSQVPSPYYSFSDPTSTPISRTLSLPTPLIHHPPVRKGDSNHFVSLTSTTYGSLVLIDPPNSSFSGQDFADSTVQMKKTQHFGNSEDYLSPDSVINTWELMEGLDDEEFDFHLVDHPPKPGKREMEVTETLKSYEFVDQPNSKPLWEHLSEESLLAKMESNVVSSYRKALLGRQHGYEKPKDTAKPEKIEALESKISTSLVTETNGSRHLMGAEDRIVLYYTSLRGIRKTYEDCCMVRVIFRGFRVCVDERDISMDGSYRKELQDTLKGKAVGLPQVFVKGKYIGSAEEIKQLNETGELAKLLEGFSLIDTGFVCDSCGDVRFVPCANCSGSRKVYDEEECKLRRCPDCNENGLIRCTVCCPCVL